MKEYKLKINGNDYDVAIQEVEANSATVEVNGTPFNVEFAEPIVKATAPKIQVINAPAAAPKQAGAAPAQKVSASSAAATSGEEKKVVSPLPGVILNVKCKDGDSVKKGQCLMVLEAMKMENNIEAPVDGTVTLKVAKGDSVLEGAVLATIK
jgi:Acetyl/propionyl-CoA carboxylase, alpha subunit